MTNFKKVLLGIAGATICGVASAGPMIWTDYYNFQPDRLITAGNGVKFTHDITDGVNGFNDATDDVSFYGLVFDLYDDADGYRETNLELAVASGGAASAYFWLGGVEIGLPTLSGFYQLNDTGLLTVTITSLLGDFYLGASTLTAVGTRSAAVPEPGTLALFGTALLGFGLLRRKRITG
jgi:hypothetical protein